MSDPPSPGLPPPLRSTHQNLALGVLEEKKSRSEGETTSDEDTSDEDSSHDQECTEGVTSTEGRRRADNTTTNDVQITMPNSTKAVKQDKKPLIQEMS